jgi:hypothetical protein
VHKLRSTSSNCYKFESPKSKIRHLGVNKGIATRLESQLGRAFTDSGGSI